MARDVQFSAAPVEQRIGLIRQVSLRRFSRREPVDEATIALIDDQLLRHSVYGGAIPLSLVHLIRATHVAVEQMQHPQERGCPQHGYPSRVREGTSGVYLSYVRGFGGVIIKPGDEEVGAASHPGIWDAKQQRRKEPIRGGKGPFPGIPPGRGVINALLSYQLFPDLVPPTILVRLKNHSPFVPGSGDKVCSIQTFLHRDRPGFSPAVSHQVLYQRQQQIALHDLLLGNPDRHEKNILQCDGLPVPIDAGYMLPNQPQGIGCVWITWPSARYRVIKVIRERLLAVSPKQLSNVVEYYTRDPAAAVLTYLRTVLCQTMVSKGLTLADVGYLLTPKTRLGNDSYFAKMIGEIKNTDWQSYKSLFLKKVVSVVDKIKTLEQEALVATVAECTANEALSKITDPTMRTIISLRFKRDPPIIRAYPLSARCRLQRRRSDRPRFPCSPALSGRIPLRTL